MTTTPPDHSVSALVHFTALQSSDLVKRDLELTCDDCGQVICDIEDNDSLLVLVLTATEHLDECDPSASSDDDDI